MRRLLVTAVLLLTACSSPAAGQETLTVFAAASLSESFRELGTAFERNHPGTRVAFSFAGSPTLVAQVQQGAPADVVVTADQASYDALRAEVAGPARVLAANALAVVAADPDGPRTLADLADPGLRVVLAAPQVPAGRAVRAALQREGVVVRPVSEEPDVKAVVAKVRVGEADAGVVYATDLRASGLPGAALPGAATVYPGGVVAGSPRGSLAGQFLDAVAAPAGQAVLARHGFLPPPSR